ncbi:MAG: DUF2254 domain-containing protein [Flavobacteriaceae bacterium]|nr:DUF2254 domain-containing protein [Flavobacteriaceae bacterium]
MKTLYYRISKYLSRLEDRIAFYPTLLGLTGVILAFLVYYIESKGISSDLEESIPGLLINDIATARLILATFIGGLISIMVFSFSMVMILLNNASRNFSPRVLPGIISNRRHQIVLGVFVGNLLFFIFVLISIDPRGDEYQLPGFSVLLSIIGMIFSLAMFVFFIHSVSQEIQVENVMKRVFFTSRRRLVSLLEDEEPESHKFENTDDWHDIKTEESGYLQAISLNSILRTAVEHNYKLSILPIKGDYVFKGDILCKVNRILDEEEISELYSNFIFSSDERVEENYVLGFKQITEIAVKAMSPGINDPGTCINAIDYLTELFILRMKKNDESFLQHEDQLIVKLRTADFKVILYSVMASLRTYVTHDIIIVNKLFSMLKVLLLSTEILTEKYRLAVMMEIENLYQDALKSIENERDIKVFENKLESLKALVKY